MKKITRGRKTERGRDGGNKDPSDMFKGRYIKFEET